MVECGFGRWFHDLKYFKVGFNLNFIFLEFIINLRASLQKVAKKHELYVVLSCFKQFCWQLHVQHKLQNKQIFDNQRFFFHVEVGSN